MTRTRNRQSRNLISNQTPIEFGYPPRNFPLLLRIAAVFGKMPPPQNWFASRSSPPSTGEARETARIPPAVRSVRHFPHYRCRTTAPGPTNAGL